MTEKCEEATPFLLLPLLELLWDAQEGICLGRAFLRYFAKENMEPVIYLSNDSYIRCKWQEGMSAAFPVRLKETVIQI